jgi:hypothetical protein
VTYRLKDPATAAPGSYRLTAAALATIKAANQAAQLATDQAAVNAGKADILNTRTILTVTGTFNLGLYTLKSGVVVAGAVLEGYHNYPQGEGGAAGKYHEATTGEIKNEVWFGNESALQGTYSPGGTFVEGRTYQFIIDAADVEENAGGITSSTTILGVPGIYHEATIAEVQSGVHFGPDSAYVGTFTHTTDYVAKTDVVAVGYIIEGHKQWPTTGGDGIYHEATVAEVQSGVHFGAGSALIGTFVGGGGGGTYPAEADTWFGSGLYGPTGAEYTPAKRASSIVYCTPGNVRDGVLIDDVLGTYGAEPAGETDDMMEEGAIFINAQLLSHASQTVTCTQGGSSVELSATIGRTEEEIDDLDGVHQSYRSRDWLIPVASLPWVPAKGMQIEEASGATWEAVSPPQGKCWRYSDGYRKRYRIYTRQIT